MSSVKIKEVHAGASYILLLSHSGEVYALGRIPAFGDYSETSHPVKIMDNVKSVAAGAYFSIFLFNDGKILIKGKSDENQPDFNDTQLFVPNAEKVYASYFAGSFWIRTSDGELLGFGHNTLQLSNGSRVQIFCPYERKELERVEEVEKNFVHTNVTNFCGDNGVPFNFNSMRYKLSFKKNGRNANDQLKKFLNEDPRTQKYRETYGKFNINTVTLADGVRQPTGKTSYVDEFIYSCAWMYTNNVYYEPVKCTLPYYPENCFYGCAPITGSEEGTKSPAPPAKINFKKAVQLWPSVLATYESASTLYGEFYTGTGLHGACRWFFVQDDGSLLYLNTINGVETQKIADNVIDFSATVFASVMLTADNRVFYDFGKSLMAGKAPQIEVIFK